MASNKDDLLALLNQVAGTPGTEVTTVVTPTKVEATEVLPQESPEELANTATLADATSEVEALLQAEAPKVVTVSPVVDAQAEHYAKVTLQGLRKYRPDLVQALDKAGAKTAPAIPQKTVKTTPVAGQSSAITGFKDYLAISQGMLQVNASQVSGRRLSNMRTKYLEALAGAGITLAKDVNPTFVINGSKLEISWAGQKPTGLPKDLDL